MLRIDVMTLFPGMFESVLDHSIMKRARGAKQVDVRLFDIRDCATDKHRTCDDKPFGGGPGMVLKPEPIDRLMQRLYGRAGKDRKHVIYMSPGGKPFKQKDAERLAGKKRFAVICGHYEGIDQRVIDRWVDEEISVGDYVLTGGELPAMTLMDSVIRLIPGVLGNEESNKHESFSENLLEYPQYTRPADFKGMKVPEVLLTGNHRAISDWRLKQSKEKTSRVRPDLMG